MRKSTQRGIIVHRKDDRQRVREEAQSERIRRSRTQELNTPVRTLIVIHSFSQKHTNSKHKPTDSDKLDSCILLKKYIVLAAPY